MPDVGPFENPYIKSFEEKLPTGETIMVRRSEYKDDDIIYYDVKLSSADEERVLWQHYWRCVVRKKDDDAR